MKKIIYNKIDKKTIGQLPQVHFQGKIVVVISEQEAEKAIDYLLTREKLGIDTETRPSFRKGERHKVSLLQVSDEDICFLFRLNFTGITPAIKRLLENKEVPLIGLSLQDDIMSLQGREKFTPGNIIDIQNIVHEIGVEDMSLQKLYANLFRQKISKRQQLTNWDSDVLNDKQKGYAALDAWACLQLYNEIQRLKTSQNFELIIQSNETTEQVVSSEAKKATSASSK